MKTIIGDCPCFECICVPACRRMKRTFNLLNKCSIVRIYFMESGEHWYQNRFIAIKQALKLDYNLEASYYDWQDLIQSMELK